MAFERYPYIDPDVLYCRGTNGATPILEIRTCAEGGVAITFYRGANPPGPYHAGSEAQAIRWVKRWIDARDREARLCGPLAPGAANVV